MHSNVTIKNVSWSHFSWATLYKWVTGQLADTPTRVLDKSRTGKLADATGDFACLVFAFGGICETASCPVTYKCTAFTSTQRIYYAET